MGGGITEVSSKKHWDDCLSKAASRAVVVDFTATWCGPCRMIGPIFLKLSEKYTNLMFLKVDVDAVADVAAECKVRAMPTFQVYVQGQKVEEIVGANPAALEAAVVKYNATSSPFMGQGRKLSDAAPVPEQAAPSANSKGEFPGVDKSAPTTTLQIRLADGHRLTGTFNCTHTVADIHRYIRSENSGCADKQLMSAYPPKPLTDMSATLEQAGLLNAAVIQKP